MTESAHGANPYRIYLVTWVILLIITVLMLVAERFHMPRWFLLSFLLVFMAVKAVMIGGNFMHLRYEKGNLSFIVAVGLVVTSLILYFFIMPEANHILAHPSDKAAGAVAAPASHGE
jgi:cytochrome c oxidase subunit IV